MTERQAEIAVVGGGPAGALTALLLARAGRDVILFERAPRWRWRACGVFASPASVAALRRLGLDQGELGRLARPIPAMDVVSARGTHFRMTYGGTGLLDDSAVGFDRELLDPTLLDLARRAGADVRVGVVVEGLDLASTHARLVMSGSRGEEIVARVVVGADGLRSRVAQAARVSRRAPLGPRAALTFHVDDPSADAPGAGRDARMYVIEHGYVGVAPVPRGRINVGIVLERPWFERLRRLGGREVARHVLDGLPDAGDRELARVEPLDHVAGVTPLGHAVTRRAGNSWLLVGDAAGFLDPFTGEGLHRAIVSAELAAETLSSERRGRRGATLNAYERAMRARFGAKDVVSRVVQGFLGRPRLFEYTARRLATRSGVRETMGLVIGDLAPASEVLDPRYLAALLAP